LPKVEHSKFDGHATPTAGQYEKQSG